MATYVPSDDLRVIARNLQRKFKHNVGELNLDKIVFLKELDSPSKTKLAVTKKIDAATKVVYGQHDYIMIFFQKRWEQLTTAQKNILVLHELLHCTWDGEKVRHHDVEDFYEIAHAFGVDWAYNPEVRDPLAAGEIVLVSKPEPDDSEDENSDEPSEDVLDPEQD